METVNYTEEQLEQMLQAKKAEKEQQRQAERSNGCCAAFL